MPTLLVQGGLKYRFYASDGAEPPHVHVVSGRRSAKIWLADLKIVSSQGYNDLELRRIQKVVGQHRSEWTEAFNGFFGL